ncbi:DEAD/DEAH box helicase [Hyalangium versicolor]|uniref:DEAD/DEAH box helicase n=1 Tax=Hyalangium versicolor TaxID=2861190 RepID=UPI0028157AF9|nr:DEAD/DEAH box helicase [Hyalangium versicolor]
MPNSHAQSSSWFIESDRLCISLSHLPPEIASRVALREDEWRAKGWRDAHYLHFSVDQWVALGRPVEYGGDEEERACLQEEWVELQHLLMDLLALEQQSIRCEVVGVPGSVGAKYKVRVDGEQISDTSTVFPWFVAPDGSAPRPLMPTAAWACTEARLASHASVHEQLARLARIRAALDDASRMLSGRVQFTPAGYLAKFEPQQVAKVGLRWESEPDATDVVSLQPYAVLPNGTHAPLPLGTVRPGGIAGTDNRRPLVLPQGAAQVLENLRPLQRRLIGDVQRELADPSVVVPEGLDADPILDLSQYSQRVMGFEVLRGRQPPERAEGSGLEWFDPSDDTGVFSFTLQIEQGEGRAPLSLPLRSREEALRLLDQNDSALAKGDSAPLVVGDHRLRPSEVLGRQLRTALHLSEQPSEEGSSGAGLKKAQGGRTREAAIVRELEATPARPGVTDLAEDSVPWDLLRTALLPGVQLKPHQHHGITWLWHRAMSQDPGVLLADDMGLGKTLQVACFLTLRRLMQREQARPQLVVCPTILLDNWRQELSRFFEARVWPEPFILHGPGLQAVSRAGELNTAFLERQDMILTNYETLGAHQRSLLKMDFDVVVFDEAHNLKNPDTLRSRAARALKRSFAVALTGTPVENELLDVWAIYDAIQSREPRVFGTRASFREEYQGDRAVAALRKRLGYPSPHCTLLRREKADALKDLPPKLPKSLTVEMTAVQEEQERLIAQQARKRGVLWALAALQKLYQHPALLSEARGMATTTALHESPKTRLCLELLERIANQGGGAPAEKALVFVLSRAMQDLLAQLIQERFRLKSVPILNGEPENRRLALKFIDDFTRAQGFQVLILSPLAAGAGLNIVAANHVIHYGRWWNPAKEDQATDRAYRIGQVRPVHVYYPLLHRQGRKDAGFDVQLNSLVERKRAMARDFLSPEYEDSKQYTSVFHS